MSSSFEVLKNKIEGKECAVLGFGVSNIPLVRVLLDLGVAKSITVYDKKPLSELSEDAAELSARGVAFVTGADSFEKIEGDVIFRSPGIRPDIPALREALARGAYLTSEIEQLLALTRARTFAITGSDGKTTSTTLTGKFLEAAGKRVFVGGNIGRPLLETCDEMRGEDACVLELSSFQLMQMPNAPEYCAITNVSPNHLDWHIDEEEYFAAKKNIVGARTERLVVNADCAATAKFGRDVALAGGKEVIFFSSSKDNYADVTAGAPNSRAVYRRDGMIYLCDGHTETAMLCESEIRLPGVHNIENYMTAIALCSGFVSADDVLDVAREFTGVEHRLEPVRTLDGVDYINGSIDSSPTRTLAALSALRGRDIVLICGGYDKNLDYAPLAPALCQSVRVLVLTGATADKIESALRACASYSGSPKIIRAASFEDAVVLAKDSAAKGGCVLLSPASASFDRFKNFAERGRYFKKLVMELS
ncbi:MAG: UDP-N-acetylmuramoyl-L-alanine--D-glutamate ligase [Ruminococcaceae bacterium]|nr:UDP-N-acetylmuramoyl-L-alanine--D-glutamate ligase [Oscillospiraceae bacterium]